MAIVFDGRAYAKKLRDNLYHEVLKLHKKPVMATILVGDDPASELYVNLKKRAAVEVGIQMDVYKYPATISEKDLISKINKFDKDETIDGIMVQLPLPKSLFTATEHILHHINSGKDVDGLRIDSHFIPATVRAVISILDEAKKKVGFSTDSYIVVVGSKGEVGSRLIEHLTEMGYEIGGVSSDTSKKDFIKETRAAKVIISATGSPDIITFDHIKKGAVVIDVGSPKGDVDFREVSKIASFITPVPGGVGPVTVASLLQNLVDAVK